jgi:hypothetical protein
MNVMLPLHLLGWVATIATSPNLLLHISPGMSGLDLDKALQDCGAASARWLEQSHPQALAEGLVKSKLLETLNRIQVTPTAEQGFDRAQFMRIATAGENDRWYTASFTERAKGVFALRFFMMRVRVPVDPMTDSPPATSRDRLHRLRDALEDIRRAGFSLAVSDKDRYGNAFAWSGSRKGAAVRVLYIPEQDELRVVIY